MPKFPEIVFLDWDGTLSYGRFWGHWQGDDNLGSAYDLIQRRFFGKSGHAIEDWMTGKLSAEDIAVRLATELDCGSDYILSELQKSCENMKLIDGVADRVDKLKELGVKVVIATDNMDTFDRWTKVAQNLEDRFDGTINSANTGVFKKEVDDFGRSPFFDDTLRRFRVTPEKTVLVDDSVNNQIVRSFGMRFRHVGVKTITEHLDEIIRESA